jgi:predicted MFS family arabinose efflux permease
VSEPAHSPEFPVTPELGSSRGYARYALALLLVVYVFNFVDRTILTILLEDIKTELELSDTYLGFLSGIAFALFYTVAGIPIARWADRGSRRTIIALACLVWSGMTAVTGLARNFGELALARVGVGVGEAGCSPPAHSLISDYFPPERRATALSIYALGIPIGAAFGNLVGGWLGAEIGWRRTFFVVGLAGVAVALLVRLTLREPVRGASEGATAVPQSTDSIADVVRFMLGQRSFVHMSIGAALHALYGYGAGAFIPSFMRRVHDFPLVELGVWLFVIGITTGALGTYMGGATSDWLSSRDRRWYMWVPALATAVGIPFAFLFYLWPDGRTALLLSVPGSIVAGMWLGPTFAMTQTLVRVRMRAMASAVLLFIINLIGMGLGPQIVGVVSDLLQPSLGDESIRYAILGVVATCASWSTLHYLLAARTLRQDLLATGE